MHCGGVFYDYYESHSVCPQACYDSMPLYFQVNKTESSFSVESTTQLVQ